MKLLIIGLARFKPRNSGYLVKTDRIRTYIPAHIPTISSRSRTEDDFKLQMPSIVGLQSSYLTFCEVVAIVVQRILLAFQSKTLVPHQQLRFYYSARITETMF